jgi:predicted RNA-binding Zn-ribbon protein involved in translation (DUF1610 family)
MGMRQSEARLSARIMRKGDQVGIHVLHQGAVMAIKRPTKGKGTPSHKPVASPPLRHVDVRAPQKMVPGEIYVGWLCRNRSCGLVIADAATAPSGKALPDFDDQLTAIKCPHCGDENLYRWSARREQNYTPKSIST